MDHMGQPTALWAVVHLTIALLSAMSAVLCAVIARRNSKVDHERNGGHCVHCERLIKVYHEQHSQLSAEPATDGL